MRTIPIRRELSSVIISSEHRYVFVELPRTGSTAIRKELVSQYGGRAILDKHSTYRDFLRVADEDEKRYFVFSGVRNPLDDAVSHYFKLKTDHHGRFTDQARRRYRLGNTGADVYRRSGLNRRGERPVRRRLNERLDNRKFDYIHRRDADFADFFRRYHWLPYDNWSRLSHGAIDRVIRFEHLRDDFAAVLDALSLEMKRTLPVMNKTSDKEVDYLRYYTEEIISLAKFVYGPYMRKWGYRFPSEWGDEPPPRWHDWLYEALGVPRSVYWTRLRGRL